MISRGFCPTCGSAIHSRNSAVPGTIFVRASSLDDPEVFQPQMIVYGKRAPSWDRMDPRPAPLRGDAAAGGDALRGEAEP